MKYSMSEQEVAERFYPHMTGKLIGMTRAIANEQLRWILLRPMERNLENRSFKSIVSRFALRVRACRFIIR